MTTPRAFTLIEVLIVVALIAVFSVLAAVNYNSARRSLEFTSVFLSVSEISRSARDMALNSKVESNSKTVPFAYAVRFQKKADSVLVHTFADTNKTAVNQATPYLFDENNDMDPRLEVYNLPAGYSLSLGAGSDLSRLEALPDKELIIGFRPPYGDVYIVDAGENPPRFYKNAAVKLTNMSSGASKWLCVNTVGGVFTESLQSCL